MRAAFLKIFLAPVLFATLILVRSPLDAGQAAQTPARTAPAAVSNVVPCKALEIHTSAQPGVTVVLFHQRDKKDQPRFASLLKQADGSTVDIRIGKGDWQPVSVARLRMCFGRGLLVFPSGSIKLRDKEEFVVRFAAKTASQ